MHISWENITNMTVSCLRWLWLLWWLSLERKSQTEKDWRLTPQLHDSYSLQVASQKMTQLMESHTMHANVTTPRARCCMGSRLMFVHFGSDTVKQNVCMFIRLQITKQQAYYWSPLFDGVWQKGSLVLPHNFHQFLRFVRHGIRPGFKWSSWGPPPFSSPPPTRQVKRSELNHTRCVSKSCQVGASASWWRVRGHTKLGGRRGRSVVGVFDKLGGGGRKRDKKTGRLSGSNARSHNTPAEDVDCAAKRRLRTQGWGMQWGALRSFQPPSAQKVPLQPPVSFEMVWCGVFHVRCTCVSLDVVAFSMRGAQCACFVQTWMSTRAHAHKRMRILCFVPSLFYSDFQNLDEPCFTAFLRRTSRRNLQDTVPDP